MVDDVVCPADDKECVSRNLNELHEKSLTFGQRTSDVMAKFAGSWVFIISFAVVLVIWIVVNTIALLKKPFDPYPYILLNLVLSCLAAIQAPVILMSQNREEARDRIRAELDYAVNVKAENEISKLHDKIDALTALVNEQDRGKE